MLHRARRCGFLVQVLERAEKQLSFFKDRAEVQKIEGLLAQTDLVQKAMPSLPIGK